MYLLYLDGSGSVKNPTERHFVLAGVAVFERQIYHLISKFDSFITSLNLGNAQRVELHASVMANGSKAPWKGIVRKERLRIIESGLKMLDDAHRSVRTFATVVDKQALEGDPVEYAFEEICNRFNLFLSRLWCNEDDKQRGLVVMDESRYEQALQGLARQFREEGTRWGSLRNMAEVPLFADSTASRLIQIADSARLGRVATLRVRRHAILRSDRAALRPGRWRAAWLGASQGSSRRLPLSRLFEPYLA